MSKRLEKLLKESLGFTTVSQCPGRGGGGFISYGEAFDTDRGRIFVKMNSSSGALKMFEGEFASLKAIEETNTIKVPKPIKVIQDKGGGGGGAYLVMEYLDLKSLSDKASAALGTKLAKMHLHNIELGRRNSPQYQSKFGFSIVTCCGHLTQGNEWDSDWIAFYTNKLEEQLKVLNDERAWRLWRELKPKIPSFFEGLDEIKPSLIHGDLWSGNIGQVGNDPVIFDPASFYGHHEYDFGIASMFGGFSSKFFKAYHELIPKAEGFEVRQKLYKLFHCINHWNHFGSGYRGSSINLMETLIRF